MGGGGGMAPIGQLVLQASLFLLLTLTLSSLHLHFFFISTTPPALSFLFCAMLVALLFQLLMFMSTRARPVLLLDYSCHLPDHDRKCPFEVCEYFVRRSKRFNDRSEDFMRSIYLKSGLGDETYAPPFIFQAGHEEARLQSAVQEAEEGLLSAIDSLLSKTHLQPSQLDTVIVTCGMFTPSPSLSSLLVRRYNLPDHVRTYNISGMGCSSGASAIDLASTILNGSRKVRYVLVAITESISLNWYFGDDRSMLVTNCIFRVGTAAALLTNDPACRGRAKLELIRSLRTHHGSDDPSYRAAYQAEDDRGNVGVALKKDLVRVAGEALRAHIRVLAPRVLPWSQLLRYAYHRAAARTPEENPHVPDFTTAFEHMCVHTGGKAVIESVGRLMGLAPDVTEPARMCLHRFGNTSSSLIFYELAYFEAKGRVREGDRLWMLAFGTGFKVCSLVWKAVSDSAFDQDNPWRGCIHRYPLKSW